MSNIAFICDENTKSLFEAFGIDSFKADKDNHLKALLEDLVKKDYRIIYILEKFAANFLDLIEAMRKEHAVSIVLVPDHAIPLNLGLDLIKRSTVDAVGTDAMFQTGETK
ncbi:MAG: hypothetical protein JW946_04445 [Candidatus Omnitrophica bacterium]|nr:hypothetical protein [Candidatus Omnitrophota bacterium]